MVSAATLLFAACSKNNLRGKFSEQGEQHNLAEFLAGHNVPESSVFFPATQKPLYERHQAYMQKLQEQIFSRHVAQIHAWQTATGFKATSRTAAYFLSGADVPNLITFFPECREYLMVALQPASEIGDPAALSDFDLNRSLERLRLTMRDISARNYFRSKVLNNSAKNVGFPGMAPIILAFLAGMNKDVVAFENVELNADGTLTQAGDSAASAGFRVYFREPGDGEIRTLVYLSMRITPEFNGPDSPEGRLIARLGPLNLLFKAAIYLFHEVPYANLARSLLKQGNLVVQDDSGIPLNLFEQGEWHFAPFGIYERTARLNDLRTYPLQTELRDLFRQDAQPLDFSFGYGSWAGRSNLLWASRVKPPAQAKKLTGHLERSLRRHGIHTEEKAPD